MPATCQAAESSVSLSPNTSKKPAFFCFHLTLSLPTPTPFRDFPAQHSQQSLREDILASPHLDGLEEEMCKNKHRRGFTIWRR